MAILACCAWTFAACIPSVHGKRGSIEALLTPQKTDEDLRARATLVEKVTTELPSQIDEYLIGPNDVLNVVVLGHDELSSPRDFNRGIVGTTVRKDGKLHLPVVGPLQAAGLTLEEFEDALRAHVASYIREPQLTVDVLRYESQKFHVLGEVNKPGTFPVDGDTTLLEAIGLAGGAKTEANLEGAYVIRENTLLPISLSDILLRGDTRRNVFMRAGDLVYVPSTFDMKVYVLGEVPKPGAIPMPSGRISLVQALAEAGGLKHVEARQNAIRVVRGGWNEPTIYTLNYESILAYGNDISLRPGDRVVVEPTGLTTANRYLQQILPFLNATDLGWRLFDRAQSP
ncbi:MAG: polysaccharide biosynthesis/export family protein [Myxococcota bacterium]|jgi:polysaccharide export outer membrane protein|nr:polysaccharide biosynthesis/export family protein [Myxococcota bacterium]